MPSRIQSQFDLYQQIGYPGQIARPNEPWAADRGPMIVNATSTRKGRPGDAVYWDTTNNGFAVPHNVATQLLVIGVIGYDGEVAHQLSAVPSGSNSDYIVQYDDDDPIKVITMGSVFLIAGGAVEYSHILRFQTDHKWNEDTPTAFADTMYRLIECTSLTGADTNIIEARISGRAR